LGDMLPTALENESLSAGLSLGIAVLESAWAQAESWSSFGLPSAGGNNGFGPVVAGPDADPGSEGVGANYVHRSK
jgi:hypothetical protein